MRILFLFIFIFFIYIFYEGLKKDPTKIPSNLISKKIPEFSIKSFKNYEMSNTDYSEIRGLINFGLLCNIILVSIFILYAPEFYSSVDTLRTHHEAFSVGYDSPKEPPMLILNILAFLPWLYVYLLNRRSDENRAQ